MPKSRNENLQCILEQLQTIVDSLNTEADICDNWHNTRREYTLACELIEIARRHIRYIFEPELEV